MLVNAPANTVLWSSIVTKNGHGQLRANSYYRVLVPFMTAKDMGLCSDFFVEGYTAIGQAATHEERALLAMLSDVMLLSNAYSEVLCKNITEMKKLVPAIDPDTLQRVYPPVCVFDQDDLTEYVSVFNEVFRHFGTRAPDGTRLKAGDEIRLRANSEEDDEPIVLWKDKECPHCRVDRCAPGMHQTFDIGENISRIELVYRLARTCHGATFTTERLSQFYRDEVGLTNVYTFPNSIYAKDYRRIELAEHPGEVRILWQGGSSHFEDWQPYAPALGRVMHKYPQAKLILWGQPFPFMLKHLPMDRTEFLPWVPHAAYLTQLNTIGHDINLAPLAATKFNSCKSAIKWYESSAITRPAATLASNVPPYSDEMVERETGLLFADETEFEEKLSELIETETLRKSLASNSKDWVYENRDSRKTVPPLIEWYMSLRKGYDEQMDLRDEKLARAIPVSD